MSNADLTAAPAGHTYNVTRNVPAPDGRLFAEVVCECGYRAADALEHGQRSLSYVLPRADMTDAEVLSALIMPDGGAHYRVLEIKADLDARRAATS
jgi:hypothetical protein